MSKTKSLVLQCLAVFLAFLGVWCWVGREYKKVYPKQVSINYRLKHRQCIDCGKVLHSSEKIECVDCKGIENPVKIYKGKWHKDYLEVIK